MRINISSAEEKQLHELAEVAGFDSVEGFVTEQVLALIRPTSEELSDSLRQCDQSMEEAARGEGRDFRESLRSIRERHGLAE